MGAVGALLEACGSSPSSSKKTGGYKPALTAGNMADLEKAAKAEGSLNVIALPPDWSNYGNIIKAFHKKYGIRVNSAAPDDSSAQELAAKSMINGRAEQDGGA